MPRLPLPLALALAVLVGPPLAAPLAGQTGRRVERRLAVAPDVALRVFNLAGATHVVGWDRDTIAIVATLPPGAGELVAGGTHAAVKIGIDAPGTPLDAPGATLEVRVPRRATVWIKGAAGAVSVRDVAGALDLYSVAGDLTVAGDPAQLSAETMSGDVTFEGTTPSARLKTADGAITLQGGAESLTIESVGGPVRVRGAAIARGEIRTVSGAVEVDAPVRGGGELALLTQSASITLYLPGSTRAALELRTFDGLLINRFAGESRPSRGKPYRVTIGAGDEELAHVSARTLKGDIAIYRRAP